MSGSANPNQKKTLLQRVTHIFVKPAEEPEVEAQPAKPVESDEKKQARLEAYQKLCEEEAQGLSKKEGKKREIKYRSDPRKSSSHKAV